MTDKATMLLKTKDLVYKRGQTNPNLLAGRTSQKKGSAKLPVWRCSGEFTSPRGGVKPPLHQTAPPAPGATMLRAPFGVR